VVYCSERCRRNKNKARNS